jgi:hypothetical protein
MENSNRKPGDIEMIFGNPVKCTTPVGLARLNQHIRDVSDHVEQWLVEYLDQEGHFYEALLKKKVNGESK